MRVALHAAPGDETYNRLVMLAEVVRFVALTALTNAAILLTLQVRHPFLRPASYPHQVLADDASVSSGRRTSHSSKKDPRTDHGRGLFVMRSARMCSYAAWLAGSAISLMIDPANTVRSLSVFFSSASVASRSLTASRMPSFAAHALRVP